MSDPMQEIMVSFFIECDELLEALVDALQTMSDGEADSETINVAFRAVHSIKGGAGAFGREDLVGFAHQFETVMDLCRSGELEMAEHLFALFFRCADMLSDLVRSARDGESIDTGGRDELLGELQAVSDANGSGDKAEDEAIDFAPMAIDLDDLDSASRADFGLPPLPDPDDLPDTISQDAELDGEARHPLTVSFRPTPELYDNGNDPRRLLKSLASLGACQVTTECSIVTSLPEVETLGSRLSWRIDFSAPVARNAVHEIFEFVEDHCFLDVGTRRSVPSPFELETPPAPKSVKSSSALAEVPALPPDDDAEQEIAPPDFPPPTGKRPASKPPAAQQKPAAAASATVRVDIERIDRLVNLVGELVINQAMLSQSITAESIPANSSVLVGLEEFLQLTRDIQESVMMIRAQPVKSLFQRMSRITREAAAAIGKPVRLITDGEQTEIDKTAIERLADPLTHMIRNAVDHGLESTERRREAGKPEQAKSGSAHLTSPAGC